MKTYKKSIPSIFTNNNDKDDLDKNSLKEFIMYNLLDQSFIPFVENVDSMLKELMIGEIDP